MRRLVYGLLVGLMCVSSVSAKVYSDKTFLMPRSHNDNMAMEYTGWHKQFRAIDDSKWGASVQATGFYQASTNKTDLGKYFGIYNPATGPNTTNPNAGKFQDFIEVKDRSALSSTNNEMAFLLDPDFIFHYLKPTAEAAADKLSVKGTFRPKQTSYGIRLDFHQKLDKLTQGLYFKATVPVVHVKNDLGISYSGTQLTQAMTSISKTPSLADYLAGNFEITDTQSKLTHAKICGSQSKSGVADVELTLGYNFLYKEHKHCGVYATLTVPTDSEPKGIYLFEPVIGKAGHWAIGLGVDGAFELWQEGNKSFEFVGSVDYKYILNATEKRTLGFRYADDITDTYLTAGKFVPMGHYFLGGRSGVKGVFPLANVLTQRVGVEPGSQIEAMASLCFNWGGFTFDAGYNLFAKERECVSIKGWTDDTYAIARFATSGAQYNYDPANNFANTNIFDGLQNAFGDGAGKWIQKSHLVTSVAETPVYVTHKVFAGATYAFNKWKYPLMLGLGGSWEFTQGTNSALDGYALWAKLGVCF